MLNEELKSKVLEEIKPHLNKVDEVAEMLTDSTLSVTSSPFFVTVIA